MNFKLRSSVDNLTDEEIDNLFDMGYKFEKGILFKRNYAIAREIYEKCAARNYPMAWNNLGWLYENGFGVEEDVEKAKKYYLKAYELGESLATVNLGNIYEYNVEKNKKPDWKAAKKWYLRGALALLGNDKAAFNYANCLHYGHGGAKDRETAFSIFKQLAGRIKGCYWYIGFYYENGFVVKKDIKAAVKYYTFGANKEDDGYCWLHLGNIMLEGKYDGVKNIKTAIECFCLAIKCGDALGYNNIGNMFEKGDIANKKDIKMAIKWYQLGANEFEEHCEKKLEKLEINVDYKPNYDFNELTDYLLRQIDDIQFKNYLEP